MDEPEQYSEFLARTDFRPGVQLNSWVNKRILLTALKFSKSTDNPRVLEVGSGRGLLAKAAHDRGIPYVGLEPNFLLARESEINAPSAKILRARLPKLPENLRGEFDVVIASHVVEHAVTGYEARDWMLAMAGCLRPGGVLVIVCPNVLSYKVRFWDLDWSHAFPTTPRNLGQIFVDVGMKVSFTGNLRLGHTGVLANLVGALMRYIFPVTLIDRISMWLWRRPLGSGLASALLWANVMVVGEKS